MRAAAKAQRCEQLARQGQFVAGGIAQVSAGGVVWCAGSLATLGLTRSPTLSKLSNL